MMKESKFTGGLAGLVGMKLLVVLICLFTVGFAMPWGVCLWQKWLAEHTVIDGRQVHFDGTGGSLFVQFVKWWFFSLITLGIYSFWLSIKMRQWVVLHTHFQD